MPKEKKNKLLFNFFSLGIVQAITSLLQLIVIPYVIAKIGVDGFGIVAVAQVVMFYLSAVTEYGFSQTATREISIHRNDRLLISRIFFKVVFSKLFLCAISFLLLLVLFAFVPVFRAHGLLYLAGFMFVIGQSVLINWFFTGMEKMQLMAVITLIARVLFVLFVFLFIKSKGDDVLYLFFLGAGNFIMGLLSIFLVIRRYDLFFIMPAVKDISEELRKGWQITATNLSNNFCQYSNIFILRFFTNDLVTGYYSIAERIFLTLRQMLAVYSQSVYPQVCLLADKGRDVIISYFKRNFVPFLWMLIAACVLLFIMSPWVVYFFIGHQNGNSSLILRIFSIVLIVACLNIPATLILLAADQRRSYFRVYTVGVILNVLLNMLLAYYFQSTGTAIAIFLTELLILLGLTREMLRLDIFRKQSVHHTETVKTE
jgi:O-antigen/teichoic acid export membrane protein